MSETTEISESPRIVRGQWFEGRFRYWRGQSGRRYLFSAVPAEDLADLHDAVVLIPAGGDRDGEAGYVGEALPGMATAGTAFVHLLAASERERREVVADLAPLAA